MSILDKLFGLDKPTSPAKEAALLLTTHGNEETAAIKALLGETDIPFFCRERGAGEVLSIVSGFNMYGTDIFVPADRLEEAKALLESVPEKPDEETDTTGIEDKTEE